MADRTDAIIELILKSPVSRTLAILFAILATTAVPAVDLAIYFPDYFKQLSLGQLLVLCLGIGFFPFVTFVTHAMLRKAQPQPKDGNPFERGFFIGALMSTSMFVIPPLTEVIYNFNHDWRRASKVITVVMLAVCIETFLDGFAEVGKAAGRRLRQIFSRRSDDHSA